MKTPIEPSEIRKGDLVRCELIKSFPSGATAHEFRAACNRDNDGWGNVAKFQWYLLDRPKPAVELPTEPTLGWIEQADDARRRLGRFMVGEVQHEFEGPVVAAERGASGQRNINRHFRVTAFTPATAVPTEAIERLRTVIRRDESDRANGWDAAQRLRGIIDTFLAAVDEANA